MRRHRHGKWLRFLRRIDVEAARVHSFHLDCFSRRHLQKWREGTTRATPLHPNRATERWCCVAWDRLSPPVVDVTSIRIGIADLFEHAPASAQPRLGRGTEDGHLEPKTDLAPNHINPAQHATQTPDEDRCHRTGQRIDAEQSSVRCGNG
jgi:hypothetical protein